MKLHWYSFTFFLFWYTTISYKTSTFCLSSEISCCSKMRQDLARKYVLKIPTNRRVLYKNLLHSYRPAPKIQHQNPRTVLSHYYYSSSIFPVPARIPAERSKILLPSPHLQWRIGDSHLLFKIPRTSSPTRKKNYVQKGVHIELSATDTWSIVDSVDRRSMPGKALPPSEDKRPQDTPFIPGAGLKIKILLGKQGNDKRSTVALSDEA